MAFELREGCFMGQAALVSARALGGRLSSNSSPMKRRLVWSVRAENATAGGEKSQILPTAGDTTKESV